MNIRVNHQAAYLLHARPWSETSLLVDMFTREHGRFRLLAKGARRQKTGQRALLQPFQPLRISWSGKSSLKTLTDVELQQASPRLQATQLASAYYMSELIFKFLHAHDAHENLFEAYDEAVIKLGKQNNAESVLRRFECRLLDEIGYGLQLKHDVSNHLPIRKDARYQYYPEKGPVEIINSDDATDLAIRGETLLALASGKFENRRSQKQSKRLLRALLTRQIPGRKFSTREVYAQMLKRKKA